jgi:ADP-ribose pyrophosphatase YjhB (NUDIX family)
MIYPTKSTASGAIIKNSLEQILIVKPNYNNYWHLPGGIIKKYESPLQACIREVKEETSLTIKPEKIISILHANNKKENIDAILFIFDCGYIENPEIIIQMDEIEDFKFIEIVDCNMYLDKTVSKMVLNYYFNSNAMNISYFEDSNCIL